MPAVTQERDPEGNLETYRAGSYSASYAYDGAGNRVSSSLSGMHDHDEANRVVEDDLYTYDYDANGNRRARVNKVTGVVEEYEHSVMGRLTGYVRKDGAVVERQARYFRDAFGRRIGKAVDMDGEGAGSAVLSLYLYDGEDMAAEAVCAYSGSLEVDAAAGTASGCGLSAIWLHGVGTDEPVVMIRDTDEDGEFEAGEALVYHTDHLGSVLAMTDMSGSVVASYFYDSFGNLAAVVNSQSVEVSASELIAGNFFTYTGREYDAESGLYYYRARHYDSNSGTFLEEDPVFMANLYPYVENDPVNWRDPFGLRKAPLVEAAEAANPGLECHIDPLSGNPHCGDVSPTPSPPTPWEEWVGNFKSEYNSKWGVTAKEEWDIRMQGARDICGPTISCVGQCMLAGKLRKDCVAECALENAILDGDKWNAISDKYKDGKYKKQ